MSGDSEARGQRLRKSSPVRILSAVLALGVVAVVILRPFGNAQSLSATVDAYCVGCHNSTDFDGGIAFELTGNDVEVVAFDPDEPDAAIWERAVRKVRAGLMPPAEAARPERAALEGFARDVESRLDRAWAADPDPGAGPLSRLNRAEYANAIRDLLDFDATDVVETLPVDEVVEGFDNISEGLSVSPTLIESYVAAAMTIAREAVGDRSATATQKRYDVAQRLAQDEHIDGLPLGTRGGMVVTHRFPLDAEYEIRISTQGAGGIARQSLCEPPEVVVSLDGALLDVADVRAFRLSLSAGPHEIAAALIDNSRCSGVNDLFDVYSVGGAIRYVEIHGPFDATGPGDTPSRRAIFTCVPREHEDDIACATDILTRLATLAFRRPMSTADDEIETLLDFYRSGRASGGFEAGVQHALARLLMSPQFIFQFEQEPAATAPGEPFRLSDLEIATRLSFFLWSSLPDAELIEAAADGSLSEPAGLEAQTLRMLADDRAHAIVENFVGQWLNLRELREALPQDAEFDANVRLALEAETSLVVSSIIEENRSLLDLLDTDFTFLNERLARHYGIEGVRGSHMRKVALAPGSPRRGILGHGSWLTATSVADRTSPVIRGEWYITHILGAPVPEPPPGVEADLSDEAEIARPDDTLRERLERHRANPTCASCHQIMDPIGLALENFDLVGRWRDTDNGRPIETATVLTDGSQIRGVEGLRAYIRSRPELFVTVFTEKLLTYALGRVVDYRDLPAVRRIVRDAAGNDYRFQDIVLGIVASAPFQMRVKSEASAESAVLAATAAPLL